MTDKHTMTKASAKRVLAAMMLDADGAPLTMPDFTIAAWQHALRVEGFRGFTALHVCDVLRLADQLYSRDTAAFIATRSAMSFVHECMEHRNQIHGFMSAIRHFGDYHVADEEGE